MNVKKYVRALLWLYLTLIIAMDAVKAQPLKVGDTLPPELWNLPLQVVNHPQGKETLTLKEYKDKFIILDFWATWCGPCIKSLTKLDTLQKEFSEQLAVIPITYEAGEKVLTFLTKRGYQLPSIINDSTLKNYFPHRSIPHQVWVRAGEVLAVTGWTYSNKENISKVLEGAFVKMLQKEDNKKHGSTHQYYSSSLSAGTSNGSSRITRTPSSIEANNVSFKSLILESFSDLYTRGKLNTMLVWNVSDTLKKEIMANGAGYSGNYDEDIIFEEWKNNNLYCYSLAFNEQTHLDRKTLYQIMRNDISHLCRWVKGVEYKIDRQQIEHWILIGEEPSGDIAEKKSVPSEMILEERPVDELVMILSHELGQPVIAGSGVGRKVSLKLDLSSSDIASLREQLKYYGFDLISKMIETEVIIISKV